MKKKTIIAAAVGMAVLASGIFWTTCENAADNSSGGAERPQPAVRSAVDVTYVPEQAAFRIVLDSEIPGLTAEDIEAAPESGKLSWQKGALSAPVQEDGKTVYTLPLIFGDVQQVADFKDGEPEGNAKITLVKEGWQFTQHSPLVPVDLIKINFESLTASPDYTSGQPARKFTLTFDKPVPGFSMEDILLEGTEKTGLEDKGVIDGKQVYELGVTGKSEFTSGFAYITPKKNGYRFTGGPSSGKQSVRVLFEFAKVNGVSLSASPRNITRSTPFPVTVNLTAVVDKTGDVSDEVDWTLKNEPEGVTLTPNADGKTAALVISEAVKTGAVTVSAASKEKASKFNSITITIEKNAGVVASDAEFFDALKSPSGFEYIVIEGRITSPFVAEGGDEMSKWQPHTIEVRDGGTLVINEKGRLWNKGVIKIRSGGKLELRSGMLFKWGGSLSNPSSGFIFGDDEILFPAGSVSLKKDDATGKLIPVVLSFDGAAKTLTASGIAGESGAGSLSGLISFTHTNRVNIPEGYTLLIKENIGLDMEYNNGGFDFGPSLTTAQEAGLGGKLQAIGGDAVLTSTAAGLRLSSGKLEGSVLTYGSSLYCAVGKEVVFAGNPLTLRKGGALAISSDHELIPAGDGVKITAGGVPGEVAAFAERSISRQHGVSDPELTVTLKIERTGSNGTLSIRVYPRGRLGGAEPKPLTIGYSLTEFDLGGAGSDWVGRIILLTDKTQITYPAIATLSAAVEIGSAANNTALKAGGTTLVTGGGSPGIRSPATVLVNTSDMEEVYIDSGNNPFLAQ